MDYARLRHRLGVGTSTILSTAVSWRIMVQLLYPVLLMCNHNTHDMTGRDGTDFGFLARRKMQDRKGTGWYLRADKKQNT